MANNALPAVQRTFLPVELIENIAIFLDPPSILNLACTSSTIHGIIFMSTPLLRKLFLSPHIPGAYATIQRQNQVCRFVQSLIDLPVLHRVCKLVCSGYVPEQTLPFNSEIVDALAIAYNDMLLFKENTKLGNLQTMTTDAAKRHVHLYFREKCSPLTNRLPLITGEMYLTAPPVPKVKSRLNHLSVQLLMFHS